VPLKTYLGPDIGSLLALARTELGLDAVIIRTEKANGGIELIAADAETAEAVGKLMAGRTGEQANRRTGEQTNGTNRSPDRPIVRSPDILAIVGPTGAGKTTAVAKLAAHPRLFEGRKVGLITLDTFRAGAIEQLQMHASMLGAPMVPVYESKDLVRAKKELGGCGVILVDCPGRGPRAQRDADAVQRLLTEIVPNEVHLALPAGMQRELARRHIEQYVARGATHLLPTKVDEVPDDWTLFDLAAERNLPMRWLADGQRVPQDLRSAKPRLDAAAASLRGLGRRTMEGVA
jgi:flagellar biosynthesis protein FlhF